MPVPRSGSRGGRRNDPVAKKKTACPIFLPDEDGFFRFSPLQAKQEELGRKGLVPEKEFIEKMSDAKYGGQGRKTVVIGLFGRALVSAEN